MSYCLLCRAASIRQAAGFLIKPPQLDPAPCVLGVHGLRPLVRLDRFGRSNLASILAVLGKRAELTPAGGERFRPGFLNLVEVVIAFSAMSFGITFQGFAFARVRRVGDRGDLPAVLLDLGSKPAVTSGDLVDQALALRRDLHELGLRLLAFVLLGT